MSNADKGAVGLIPALELASLTEKVLVHFNVVTNPTHTPLLSKFSFKPNEKQCDPKFCQKYQQLVGSLMYLMIGSRSDIGFAVVKLAQQMANPSNDHY